MADMGSSYDETRIDVTSYNREGAPIVPASAACDDAGDRDAPVDGLAEVEDRALEVEVVGDDDGAGRPTVPEDLVGELGVLDRRPGSPLLGDPVGGDARPAQPVAHRLRLGPAVLRRTAGDDDTGGRVGVGEPESGAQPLLEHGLDVALRGQPRAEDDDVGGERVDR